MVDMGFLDMPDALGIEVKILFAPIAKRLERIARSNAQNMISKYLGYINGLQLT